MRRAPRLRTQGCLRHGCLRSWHSKASCLSHENIPPNAPLFGVDEVTADRFGSTHGYCLCDFTLALKLYVNCGVATFYTPLEGCRPRPLRDRMPRDDGSYAATALLPHSSTRYGTFLLSVTAQIRPRLRHRADSCLCDSKPPRSRCPLHFTPLSNSTGDVTGYTVTGRYVYGICGNRTFSNRRPFRCRPFF